MATCPTTTRQLSRNDFVQTGPNVDVEQTRRIKGALKVRSDCTQLSPFVSADCSNALLGLNSSSFPKPIFHLLFDCFLFRSIKPLCEHDCQIIIYLDLASGF